VEHECQDTLPIAVWDNSKDTMPYIVACIPYYDFHYATLKYIFYKVDKLNKNSNPYKPMAECFISFGKLLGF
jgi:hypothetical protein